MNNSNALRKEEPVDWQVEDDYLAARGYPMTAHNRNLVRKLVVTCPDGADRKSLFRYLDERLLRRTRA